MKEENIIGNVINDRTRIMNNVIHFVYYPHLPFIRHLKSHIKEEYIDKEKLDDSALLMQYFKAK